MTGIILPDGRQHMTEEQKTAEAGKCLFLAAKIAGERFDKNPLVMAKMMIDTALGIIEGVMQQDHNSARIAYSDGLASMVGFARATSITDVAVEVEGKQVVMPSAAAETKH